MRTAASRRRRPARELVHEMNAIAEVVGDHPDGIRRSAIARELEGRLARVPDAKTLSRRLERLTNEGRIRAVGERKARKYVPAGEQEEVADNSDAGVDFTAKASGVLALVRRPLARRTPVGYDRSLLDDYVPGRSWYLPDETRRRLAALGTTPDAGRPAGTFARDIHARLLIDLSWASSHLEGNTYSRLDTQNLIEFGQRATGKDLSEAQMILNHKSAIEFLIENAAAVGFDRHTMQSLHAMLSENLLGDARGEGSLRTTPIGIGGSTYVPTAIPSLIEELFDGILQRAAAIEDPFEQAFFVMLHLPYLQPFIDVNKRTSRLAANIPLIKGNFCPLSFVDVPVDSYVGSLLAVYELRALDPLRELFEWAYERSCARYRVVRESLGAPDPFRLRYRDQLREAVQAVVQGGVAPAEPWLHDWAVHHGVPELDLTRFAQTALDLVVNLSEGAATRYRIRPSEYASWRARFATSP